MGNEAAVRQRQNRICESSPGAWGSYGAFGWRGCVGILESTGDIGDIGDMKDINLADLPDPQELFKRLSTIIERYNDPDLIQQITENIDKDPGQLARKQLGIQNE